MNRRKTLTNILSLMLLTSCGLVIASCNGGSNASASPTIAIPRVYVTNYGESSIWTYTVGNNGELTYSESTPTTAAPVGIAFDIAGAYVYVLNVTVSVNDRGGTVYSSNILTYAVKNGVLAYVESTPTTVGSFLSGIALDSSATHAYVTNRTGSSIFTYAINNGVLSYVESTPAGQLPYNITLDPSGRYAYVANTGVNSIWTYSLNNGVLTYIESAATGAAPIVLTLNSAGTSAYVVNQTAKSIWTYTVNNGAFTYVESTPIGSGGRGITLDLTGTHAYVTSNIANSIWTYTVNNGTLTYAESTLAGRATNSIAFVLN